MLQIASIKMAKTECSETAGKQEQQQQPQQQQPATESRITVQPPKQCIQVSCLSQEPRNDHVSPKTNPTCRTFSSSVIVECVRVT
jgi:hypothetical protein